ncbi:phosphopyruvate hydratase [candidate division WWE3 bacterium CG08_land_8_20_14_0_20_41_10]|uniref:Enolase n=1 Tax=candidate division WWE3 bacterium CG08_land_8_20_14_0_20_41_10 TaxID=1975085 RepID=A0A2H0XAP1_UNCKA|nr:MAG: phosphopyruvate hydratase [candidate division WWE3 bacterium CG08_land_8_20_14_0_20_41_10]
MNEVSQTKSIKVLNSRGDWTIKTYLELAGGSMGWAIVPEGASKGEQEAVCLEVNKSLEIVRGVIAPALLGKEFKSQQDFDEFLINLDGTKNKGRLGGNTIISLSIAFARAVSQSQKKEVWSYLRKEYEQSAGIIVGDKLPKYNITPLFNILNGGKHAQNKLSFQEFMLIPAKKYHISDSLEIGRTVYKSLKKRLEKDGFSTGVGDEGGFAPEGFTVRKALDYIVDCANEYYKVGEEVFLGIDAASESFYGDGRYIIAEEHLELDAKGLKDYYANLLKCYPLIYLEDPFHEEDFQHWQEATKDFGEKIMISADDLVVTNPIILANAVNNKLANTVIVKPNQVGTVWETLQFVAKARKAGWNVVVSHRSGDTEDSFIADLAYAVGADFVKFGAIARGERTGKFNRFLEIDGRNRVDTEDVLDSIRQYKREKKNGTLVRGKELKDLITNGL